MACSLARRRSGRAYPWPIRHRKSRCPLWVCIWTCRTPPQSGHARPVTWSPAPGRREGGSAYILRPLHAKGMPMPRRVGSAPDRVLHGAHLDRAADTDRRDARGDRERLVQILALHQVIPPELLLGLDERAIRDDRLAVPLAHGRAGRARAELHAGAELALLTDGFQQLVVLPHDASPLLLRQPAPPLLVDAAHQPVLHGGVPPSRNSRAGRARATPSGGPPLTARSNAPRVPSHGRR